jgi:hypothetical protein
MLYIPSPRGFPMAIVTDYKLEELLLLQDIEYIEKTWEKRLKKPKIWISVNYDNIIRAINEYLLNHDYVNLVRKLRTRYEYLQKHIDAIARRIIEFCRRHKLKRIPQNLLIDLIEYELQRRIILRNYVRDYRIPYKYS